MSSAGEARRFVRRVLTEWRAEGYVDAATLAVSELVTNAVLHARSGPVVTIRLEGDRLRIEVADDSAIAPSRKRYGAEAGTGRGLVLVESLSVAWGTNPSEHGKSVWFELDPSAGDVLPPFEFSQADLTDLEQLGEPSEPGGPREAPRRPSGGGHREGDAVDRAEFLVDAWTGGWGRR